jgi:hypothetical protein
MAKIARTTQKIFGSGAGATGITEYGSPATGTPVYTTSVADMQSLAAWLTGWSAAALAGSEIPTFQDFNAIHHVATSQLAYLFQEGLAEFDVATEYTQNSIVKKPATYELYGSIINLNTGNALPSQVDDANWKYLGNLGELVNVSASPPGALLGIVNITLTGTYNKSAGCNSQRVRIWGAGGGSGTSSTGGVGGSTAFDVMTAVGGGRPALTVPGVGGTATGGDINMKGSSGSQIDINKNGAGGGDAPGGGGAGGGAPGTADYAGGFPAGGASLDVVGTATAGSGGYAEKLYTAAITGVSVIIGAGGTAGTSGSVGGNGLVIVEEYS